MVSYTNAATMYGMIPNMYYNQVALNDLTNMNLSYPTSLGADPMFSMNASIFGGGMGYGIGMPFMPSFCGGNINSYYDNYNKYQDFMTESMVRRQQKMREADLRLNAPQEGIQKQAELLHERIIQNEQEQIQIAYNSFINSVRALYPNADKEQIDNRADFMYKQLTGSTIHEDIRKNGRGSFTQGLLQTLTLGFADSKTAEENISDLTGLPVGRSENTKKVLGNVAGGALIGGTAAAGAGLLFKGLCKGMKNKSFWAILVGAAAGLVASFTTAK